MFKRNLCRSILLKAQPFQFCKVVAINFVGLMLLASRLERVSSGAEKGATSPLLTLNVDLLNPLDCDVSHDGEAKAHIAQLKTRIRYLHESLLFLVAFSLLELWRVGCEITASPALTFGETGY